MCGTIPLLLLCLTPAADSPTDVAARALAERAKMKTAYVSGRLIGTNAKVKAGNYDFDFQIWRTPEKFRIDLRPRTDGHVKDWSARLVTPAGPTPKPHDREVICDRCRPDGGGYYFALPQTAVEAYPPNSQYAKDLKHFTSIDPRTFGMVLEASFGLFQYDLNDELGSPKVKFDGLTETTRDEERVIVLTGTRVTSGSAYRITILPDKGHSVARIEAGPGPGSDRRWLYAIESEPARDPVSGTWYTHSYRYRRESGGVVEFEERLTIDRAEIDRPIDTKVFTLAGMDIPVGKAYRDVTGDRLQYWDGSKVVRESPIKPAGQANVPAPIASAPEPVDSVSSRVRWWAVGAAVLFAGAAVLFLRRAIVRATPG